MKKIISLALVLTMIFALGAVGFAANSTGGNTNITTVIDVTYTVTIPEDTAIAYGATSTALGNVAVTAARIEAGKTITVSATGDSILSCGEAEIPYVLKQGADTFTSAGFTGIDSKALCIAIEDADWTAAPAAGTYEDIITFTVTYA